MLLTRLARVHTRSHARAPTLAFQPSPPLALFPLTPWRGMAWRGVARRGTARHGMTWYAPQVLSYVYVIGQVIAVAFLGTGMAMALGLMATLRLSEKVNKS